MNQDTPDVHTTVMDIHSVHELICIEVLESYPVLLLSGPIHSSSTMTKQSKPLAKQSRTTTRVRLVQA